MVQRKKKKDPWGSAAANPFTDVTTPHRGTDEDPDPRHDYTRGNAPGERGYSPIPSPEQRARNRRMNYQKGLREGFVMAEDGTMVPRSYYGGGGGGGGGGSRNPYGNVGGRGGGGGPCQPGYAMAEDGTCVPADFWDKSKGKTGRNAKTGAPIKW